jgi:hypothetical protein
MEIQSLKVVVTDAALAGLLEKAIPKDQTIEGLQVRLTPEGVQLQGEYPTGFGFKVPFDTLWQLTPAGPVLQVQLVSVKVAGLPAGLLRGALLRMARDSIEKHPGLLMQEEMILIDVPALAKHHGVELKMAFTAVRMSSGSAVIEAGG